MYAEMMQRVTRSSQVWSIDGNTLGPTSKATGAAVVSRCLELHSDSGEGKKEVELPIYAERD